MGFKFSEPTPEFLTAFNALIKKRVLEPQELEDFKQLMYDNDPYVTNGWPQPRHILYSIINAGGDPSVDQRTMADIVFANMLRVNLDKGQLKEFICGITELRDEAGRGFIKLAEYLSEKRSLPMFQYVPTDLAREIAAKAKPDGAEHKK